VGRWRTVDWGRWSVVGAASGAAVGGLLGLVMVSVFVIAEHSSFDGPAPLLIFATVGVLVTAWGGAVGGACAGLATAFVLRARQRRRRSTRKVYARVAAVVTAALSGWVLAANLIPEWSGAPSLFLAVVGAACIAIVTAVAGVSGRRVWDIEHG